MRGTLIGRIYPRSFTFNLGEAVLSTFSIEGRDVRAHMNINDSVVAVTMLDDVPDSEFATFKNAAQAQIRKFANYATLNAAMFNVVVLEDFVDASTGMVLRISHHEPLDEGVQERSQSLRTPTFTTLDTESVAHALEAYNNAIREHDFTAKFALEAIEAVRSYWGDVDKWPIMRANLNLKEETLKRHNAAATSQKHGKNLLQGWAERKDQLLVAREVVRRLIAFLEGGSKPLPKEAFPEY